MKAYVYRAAGRLETTDVPEPRAETSGAVMRVLASSICGTDLRTYRSGNPTLPPGRVIGHEACGEIVETGHELEGFNVGDRVVIAPAIGCGECEACRRGRTNMCDTLRTIGFEYDGTFAEYTAIPPQAFRMGNVIRLEPDFPPHDASLAEPVACCINGQRFLGIGPGDVVVVFGAGFIGSVHAELALKKGASRVILADISQDRLDAAAGLIPEVETVNSAEHEIEAVVMRLTSGRGADVVITANPDGRTHTSAMRIAAKSGRISLFGGVPGDGVGYLDSNAVHYKELSVFGSHATPPGNVREVLGLLAAGELDLAKYVSDTYPLGRIGEAFERLRKADVMKLLIEP